MSKIVADGKPLPPQLSEFGSKTEKRFAKLSSSRGRESTYELYLFNEFSSSSFASNQLGGLFRVFPLVFVLCLFSRTDLSVSTLKQILEILAMELVFPAAVLIFLFKCNGR